MGIHRRVSSGEAARVAPVLPERYTEPRLLAHGGMGSVWCAQDVVLERRVAIKLLSESLLDDDVAVGRFMREARAAARLSGHPNVVTIFDVGTIDGRPYMVMEHLAGGTVADALRLGAYARPEGLRWIHQAAAALDHAHSRGIVHRDVKPANMLLGTDRVLHLADFGIASLGGEPTLSATGELFGTAAYLSPEQAVGLPATAASDRYALAVAAFELLTAVRPFAGESFAEQARAHIEDLPPRATTVGHGLPSAVDSVLRRGMAKPPEERWPTATSFAEALSTAVGADDAEAQTAVLVDPPAGARPPAGATPSASAISAASAIPPASPQEFLDEADDEPIDPTPAPAPPPFVAPPSRRPARARAPISGRPAAAPRAGRSPRPGRVPPRRPVPGAGAAPADRSLPIFKSVATTRGKRLRARALAVLALGVVVAIGIVIGTGTGGGGPATPALSADRPTSKTHATAVKTRAAKAGTSTSTPSTTTTSTTTAGSTSTGTTATTHSTPVAHQPHQSATLAASLEARGHALMTDGAYVAALPVLREAVATAPRTTLTYAYALYDLGRTLRLSGDPAAAIPILELRLQIPNQPAAVEAELVLAKHEAAAQADSGTATTSAPATGTSSAPSAGAAPSGRSNTGPAQAGTEVITSANA